MIIHIILANKKTSVIGKKIKPNSDRILTTKCVTVMD